MWGGVRAHGGDGVRFQGFDKWEKGGGVGRAVLSAAQYQAQYYRVLKIWYRIAPDRQPLCCCTRHIRVRSNKTSNIGCSARFVLLCVSRLNNRCEYTGVLRVPRLNNRCEYTGGVSVLTRMKILLLS